MTTTTLSSKGRFKNLLLGMLRKNLSIGAYLTAILFFFFPLQQLLDTMQLSARMAREGATFTNYSGNVLGIYTDVALMAVAVLMVLATVVVGLMQCSFLHSKRAVDLYHSLPVTRTQLLCASLLTAFLTVMVPFFINYILNLFATLYRHSVLGAAAEKLVLSQLCWDVFGWISMVLSILSILLVVATQVGSVFENFVFTCELLAAPPLIILINDTLCQLFLTGYVTPWSMRFLAASTPVGVMVGRYENGVATIFYNWASVIWLLLGGALFVAALLLYRRRKSELAETPGCRGAVGTVLTALAVYIGGIALGGMLWAVAGENENELLFLLWAVVGSVLVYLLVAAILNRGFGGLRKMLPKGVVLCTCVLLSVLAITTGGLGYERRCPAAASVESVTVSYRGWYDYVVELDVANPDSSVRIDEPKTTRYSYRKLQNIVLSSPEAVEQLRRIHQQLATEKEQTYSDSWEITYGLKTGKLQRRYNGYGTATKALIEELEELPEFQQQTNPLLRIQPETVEKITLHDSLGFPLEALNAPADIRIILEALRQDALANGTRDFTANSPVVGYLYLHTLSPEIYEERPQPLTENQFVSFSLPIFESYTHLAAALQGLGKANMLQPADPGTVTAVGVDDYYTDYRSSESLVAAVGLPRDVKGEKDSEYRKPQDVHQWWTPVEGTTVQQLLSGTERASKRKSMSGGRFYVTLYRGEERGITLPTEASKMLRELLPQLSEKLWSQYQELSPD